MRRWRRWFLVITDYEITGNCLRCLSIERFIVHRTLVGLRSLWSRLGRHDLLVSFVDCHFSPCLSITYASAARTSSRFHSQRVLPCRAHLFRSAGSNPNSFKRRLAKDFRSFINSLGLRFRVDQDVNVIRPDMSRKQVPATIRTTRNDGCEHGLPAVFIQEVRRLIHLVACPGNPFCVGLNHTASGQIVGPIDRAACIAMEMATIASERNQICHPVSFDSTEP